MRPNRTEWLHNSPMEQRILKVSLRTGDEGPLGRYSRSASQMTDPGGMYEFTEYLYNYFVWSSKI